MADVRDKRILYVDDEEHNLFVFKANFRSKYEVVTVLSGQEGLEELDNPEKPIDAVISDMNMPEMNGVEFITKAKEKHDIPFYILTGFDNNKEIENAIESKMVVQLFNKPLNVPEISEAIDRKVG